jgi:hypothetical protein
MLKGEVEIIIRDAETLKEIRRIKKSNVITTAAYSYLITGNNGNLLPGTIICTSKLLQPSPFAHNIAWNIQNSTSITGPAVPGHALPEFFPASGGVDQFSQWSARMPVPTSVFTINSVALTDLPYNEQGAVSNPGFQSNPEASSNVAFVILDSPCIQQTNQVFDIYYRIFYPSTNYTEVPTWVYDNLARCVGGDPSGYGPSQSWYFYTYSNPLPQPTAQLQTTLVTAQTWWDWNNTIRSAPLFEYSLTGSISPIVGYQKRKWTQSLSLTQYNGRLVGSLYYAPNNSGGTTNTTGSVVSAVTNLSTQTKIQNIIGHKSTSATPMLDIDNLQQGTGICSLGGTWTNRSAPANAGYWYDCEFPDERFITIGTSGSVGTSTYTWSKRKTFGYQTYSFNNTWTGQSAHAPMAEGRVTAPSFQYSGLGDVSLIGVEQISGVIPYGIGGIAYPAKNSVLVYQIAGGSFWQITGSFTNITQLATKGTVIYISCRNTGLWVCDPTVTTVATQVTASGIDFSHTYGVSAGHGGSIIVAANNCIAITTDGSTWTNYDATSTPALNFTGISDSNYANISYLKVDPASTTYNLMMVLLYNSSANSGNLGVWWSTAGTASLAPTDSFSSNSSVAGKPRWNKTHLGVSLTQGLWFVFLNNTTYPLTFGSATLGTDLVTYPTTVTGYIGDMFGSLNFATDSSGNDYLIDLRLGEYPYEPQVETSMYIPSVRLFTQSGQHGTTTLGNVPVLDASSTQFIGDNINAGYPGSTVDMYATIFLPNSGVAFHTGVYESSFTGSPHLLQSLVFEWASDRTYTGGANAQFTTKSYGWSGSAWVLGNTTAKPTHTGLAVLDQGVSVQFADGTSGTSFISTDFYNFMLAEGFYKDNATTSYAEYSFYYYRVFKNVSTVSASTIPSSGSTGFTGQVTLDTTRNYGSGTTQSGSTFETTFAGENQYQVAYYAQEVSGNFEIQYTCDPSNNLMYGVSFGIGKRGGVSLGQFLQYYFYLDPTGAVYVCDYNVATYGPYGTIQGGVTDIRIIRSGNSLIFKVQGATQQTFTLSTGNIRFSLNAMTDGDYQPNNMVAGRCAPSANINVNTLDNSVKVGSSSLSTGAFDPRFIAIDGDAQNAITVMLNGVPATTYHLDGSAPLGGEVTIDPYQGTFHFNFGDEGKSVSINCTYMSNS